MIFWICHMKYLKIQSFQMCEMKYFRSATWNILRYKFPICHTKYIEYKYFRSSKLNIWKYKYFRSAKWNIWRYKYFRSATWNARMTQSPIWSILRSALKMVWLFSQNPCTRSQSNQNCSNIFYGSSLFFDHHWCS